MVNVDGQIRLVQAFGALKLLGFRSLKCLQIELETRLERPICFLFWLSPLPEQAKAFSSAPEMPSLSEHEVIDVLSVLQHVCPSKVSASSARKKASKGKIMYALSTSSPGISLQHRFAG